MKRIGVLVSVATVCFVSARGQGFLNLNFESANNLPQNPGNGVLVAAANALPDWVAYNGDAELFDVYYVSNNFLGPTTSVELEAGSLVLNGSQLSVGLYVGGSISQTAVVPGNAESLEFEAQGPGAGGSFGASGFEAILGGQNLSLSATYNGPNYIEYGANIPPNMDGQVEELTFSCQGLGTGNVLLDDIQFSSSPTPEPGELALIGLGVGLFYMRKRLPSPRLRRTGRKRRVLTAKYPKHAKIWTG